MRNKDFQRHERPPRLNAMVAKILSGEHGCRLNFEALERNESKGGEQVGSVKR